LFFLWGKEDGEATGRNVWTTRNKGGRRQIPKREKKLT